VLEQEEQVQEVLEQEKRVQEERRVVLSEAFVLRGSRSARLFVRGREPAAASWGGIII
jgi:hypothetical protein